MSVNIRLADASDQPPIEEIVKQAYTPYIARIGQPPGPMLDDYATLINNQHIHIAEQDSIIKGFLVLIPQQDSMLLDNIAVSPSAQGMGIGRILLDFAEQAARDAGYVVIKLYTHETMTENIAIYSKLGYLETRRVLERGLKRVYMAKSL
ncbi:N-acetyltransferase GCN5 [Talaromyces proteolyticus]|uniref:N-acetyltransferase GCN5 n=1 Tax=Talaromyces proteolyticus TaxID=1131652 RepID=A0AAD4KSX2_9EURO|nr:N-acetyltransferase GCN5 [Talaromyces proteolyticus]KAH8695240.1 N-acetyltransferase GCN5 [Talaromyces proteolyticus]